MQDGQKIIQKKKLMEDVDTIICFTSVERGINFFDLTMVLDPWILKKL